MVTPVLSFTHLLTELGHDIRNSLHRYVMDAVRAYLIAYFFNRLGGGHELLPVGGVDSVLAGELDRRRTDHEVDLCGSSTSHEVYEPGARRSPHYGIIYQYDPLAFDCLSHEVQL